MKYGISNRHQCMIKKKKVVEFLKHRNETPDQLSTNKSTKKGSLWMELTKFCFNDYPVTVWRNALYFLARRWDRKKKDPNSFQSRVTKLMSDSASMLEDQNENRNNTIPHDNRGMEGFVKLSQCHSNIVPLYLTSNYSIKKNLYTSYINLYVSWIYYD